MRSKKSTGFRFDKTFALISVLLMIFVYFWRRLTKDLNDKGLGAFFDTWDVSYYFNTSAWVSTPDALYREIVSDYSLAPNLLFGFMRFLSTGIRFFDRPFDNFYWLWVSLALIMYAGVLLHFKRQKNVGGILLWATPSVVYFTAFRYDIYTAVTCLLALEAIRKEKWQTAAAWFSVCIALKGYGLFLLPTLFTYLWQHTNFRNALKFCIICVVPFVICAFLPYLWAGPDGMLMPFRFQGTRPLNGESTYDIVEFAMRGLGISSETRNRFVATVAQGTIPKILQIFCALFPMVLQLKNFQTLIYALLFALVGFVSTSIFYSPQYVLWIIAIACFVPHNRALIAAGVLFGWATFFQAPVAGAYRYIHQKPYKNMIAAVTFFRLVLWGIIIKALRRA